MENKDIFDLQMDTTSQNHLLETAKWGKFLSIVGFVMIALFLVSAFEVTAIFSATLSSTQMPPFMGIGLSAGFIIVALLGFIPTLLLFQFSTKLKKSIQLGVQEGITQAFSKQKSLYKYLGVVLIVYLCFLALILILEVLGQAFANKG
jgi:hypothetical protein